MAREALRATNRDCDVSKTLGQKHCMSRFVKMRDWCHCGMVPKINVSNLPLAANAGMHWPNVRFGCYALRSCECGYALVANVGMCDLMSPLAAMCYVAGNAGIWCLPCSIPNGYVTACR